MTDRWAEQSIDPALFSQELMANASGLVVDEEVYFMTRKIGDDHNFQEA